MCMYYDRYGAETVASILPILNVLNGSITFNTFCHSIEIVEVAPGDEFVCL